MNESDDPAQATATVTITLGRTDADIVQSALTCAEWEAQIDEQDSKRIQAIIEAALAAAPPPAPPLAPSELEQAITACHDRNLNLCTWRTESGEYAATVTTRTYPMLRPTTYRGEGVTLTEAVRAALAAGRSAGESSSETGGTQ